MIRAFVAIDVPQPLAGTLVAAQVGLEVGNPVPVENFHVTLAFLGEHSTRTLEDVAGALSLIGPPAFEVSVSGLGTFGTAPRLLFAEVVPSQSLADLRKRVRRAAAEGGVELPHERYHPHITLARLGRGLVGEDAERLRSHIARRMGMVTGSFQATAFTLYESHLGSSGPVYSVLADFPLAPGDG